MLPNELLGCYFNRMVGRLYKILPLKEAEEETVDKYLDSLLSELLGVEAVSELKQQPYYVSIVGIVSFLSDNITSCSTSKVKRDVFRAINLCKKLEVLYTEGVYAGGDIE